MCFQVNSCAVQVNEHCCSYCRGCAFHSSKCVVLLLLVFYIRSSLCNISKTVQTRRWSHSVKGGRPPFQRSSSQGFQSLTPGNEAVAPHHQFDISKCWPAQPKRLFKPRVVWWILEEVNLVIHKNESRAWWRQAPVISHGVNHFLSVYKISQICLKGLHSLTCICP